MASQAVEVEAVQYEEFFDRTKENNQSRNE